MAAYRRVYDLVTCKLTAKNRDQLRNPTLGNRVWATIIFYSANHYATPPINFVAFRYVTNDASSKWVKLVQVDSVYEYKYLYSPIVTTQHTILQHYKYKNHRTKHYAARETNQDLKCRYTTPARCSRLAFS